MQRVVVVGSGGAGKSTFSRRLGALTGLPVVHLDDLYWRPGWEPTPVDEWRAVQARVVTEPRWIVDGNYSATLDVRLERADTVVFLDFPRALCLSRALWRVARNHGRAVQAAGCPERFDGEFIRWIWSYRTRSRPRVLDAIARHRSHLDLVCLTRPRDARRWLASSGDG